MTEIFNKLFVSYQTLYSRGGFFHLLSVNAVVWINHTIMQLNSSYPCFTQGAEALWCDTCMRKITSKFYKVYFGNKGWSLNKKTNKPLFFPNKWGHAAWLPGPSVAVHNYVIFLKGNTKWYYVVIYFLMPLGLSSTVIISTAVLKTGFWLK